MAAYFLKKHLTIIGCFHGKYVAAANQEMGLAAEFVYLAKAFGRHD